MIIKKVRTYLCVAALACTGGLLGATTQAEAQYYGGGYYGRPGYHSGYNGYRNYVRRREYQKFRRRAAVHEMKREQYRRRNYVYGHRYY